MSTLTNLQTVATVLSVAGVAFARNADGAVRRLAAGDTILEGEIVFTLADGQVKLAFSDGHSATILASESYLMGPEAMIATSPGAGESAIAAAGEVEKVIQALEEGADVLQELEAPAAGVTGGGDEGGHSFVRLLRISEGVNPVGFDYPLNPIGYIKAPEFEAIPEEEEEPPVNGLPDISAGNATVDEEDVIAGGNPGDSYTDNGDMGEWNATGTLNVDFGPDGAGSLAIAATNYAATWNAGTNTLSANDGSWTLVYNPATNEYAFNLVKPLAHPEANTEDDRILNFTATVTDSNGDSESASFMVTVDDDAPVRAEVENEPVSIAASVEEDDLSRADAADPDLSDGNNEDLSTDADQASNVLYGSLASLVSVGADKPLSFSLEDTATVNELLPTLYSNGEPVSYAVSTVADTDGDGMAESVLTASADGRTVFTLTVNSSGTWKFDLDDQLDHLNDGANDENWELVSDSGPIAAIDFTKVLVAADADGDELPWSENDVNVFTVAVQDDVPVAWGADYTRAAHPNGSTALCTAGGKLFYADGADEVATVAFDYTTVASSRMADEVGLTVIDKFGSGLTSSSDKLYWVVSDGDGGYVAFGSPGFESATTLYAAIYDDMAGSFNTPVFTVALDGMNGTYTITVEGIMDQAARSIDIDLTGGVSGGNAGWYLLGAVELNNTGEETFNDGSTHNDVLVYALGAAETINSRQGGLGAGIKGGGGDASLFIHEADGNPEGVQFNFVEGLVFDKHDYDEDDSVVEPNTQSYRSLDSVTVTMGATQGNDPTSIKVLAYDESHNLVPVTVTSGDGTAYLYDPDGAGGQDPYWVVDGLTQGETFTVSASSPDGVSILEVWYHHSTVDYDGDSENDDPAGFLLSSLMYSIGIVGSTIDMALPYTVTDYDGDTVVAGMDFAIDPEGEVIHVLAGDSYEGDEAAEIVYGDTGAETISGGEGDDVLVGRCGDDELHGNEGDDILVGGGSLPSEPGVTDNDVLYGEAGNDSLHGSSGDDLLVGGAGSDTMTGGFGADTFAWMPGDEGSPAPIDRITDFDMAAGSDKLDLSDLLQGETGMDAEGLAGYLSFSLNSEGHTEIAVSSAYEGPVVQTIVLEGIDLVTGFADDQAIIQSLLDNGKLVTD